MKSYIKLFGPSIDKGLDSLHDLIKELGKRYQYGDMVSHIVSVIDPSLDLMTGKLIRKGKETLAITTLSSSGRRTQTRNKSEVS